MELTGTVSFQWLRFGVTFRPRGSLRRYIPPERLRVGVTFRLQTQTSHFVFGQVLHSTILSPNPKSQFGRYATVEPARPNPGKVLLANFPSRDVVSQQRTQRQPTEPGPRTTPPDLGRERIWGPPSYPYLVLFCFNTFLDLVVSVETTSRRASLTAGDG